ncbi:MAG: S41 family peptidase, partial [Planctomycetota bacterium]|nr:S41 family peptidase [Planctomycetota bacterium]
MQSRWPTILMLFASAIIVLRLPAALAKRAHRAELALGLVEVAQTLESEFVRELTRDELREGAIQGMVESASDPYTVWIPPRDRDEFVKEVQGTFAGIGVSVSSDPRGALVRTPLDDSPALEAGIQAGDLIVAVGHEDLTGMALSDIIALVAGPEGSSVEITVLRNEQEQTFTVARRQIGTQTVLGLRRTDGRWQWQLEDGVLVVRVDQFLDETPRDLRSVIEDHPEATALVLDLRSNPGGSLSAAVETCDLFLDGGLVVEIRNRREVEAIFEAQPEVATDVTMVVLVNEGSASASEIVAGALQFHQRAVVVGRRTYGKGSVQKIRDFGGGGTLKYTAATYHLPDGRSVQRVEGDELWGVDPDVVVDAPEDWNAVNERWLAAGIITTGPDWPQSLPSQDWIR